MSGTAPEFAPEVEAAIARVREDVARLHGELTRNGLVVWTGGNVSGRVPGADLFVIKPSGVSYDDLAPENMILCDLDGNVIPGTPAPDAARRRDTAAHAYVYRNMPDVGGVVHTHSTFAVGLGGARRGDPVRDHGDGRRVRRPDPGRSVRDHRRRLDRTRDRRDPHRATGHVRC